MQQYRPTRHALLSISNKAGIVELAQTLFARGVKLLSTSGAARLLADKGLPVTEVSDYTGFPEMMNGRVKTLYPKAHGSILGRRGQSDGTMQQHGIVPINTVAVNLYPFAQTVAREGCSLEDAVENIDIGSSITARSAAENHKDVAIVVESSDYDAIINKTDANEDSLTLSTHFDLATKALEYTAAYDNMIANYFGSMVPAYHDGNKEVVDHFPCALNLDFIRKQDIRCDENSRQQAAFYIEENVKEVSVAIATQLWGRALSYNNIADTNAVLECAKKFNESACVIVKHANPCGVAVNGSVLDAYDCTYKTDPTSAFDGIITFNRELGAETVQAIISRQFVEVVTASSANEEALKITVMRQNIRALVYGQQDTRVAGLDFRRVNGDLLVRDRDLSMVTAGELCVVSKRQPSEQGLHNALLCWKVVKLVKPDAIAHAKDNMTIGISAGQTSRVYPVKTAGIKTGDEGLEVKGSAMTSDASFPFRGSIDTAATVGITCVIQLGGSVRDGEVIAAVDEHGIAMISTDVCHFRH